MLPALEETLRDLGIDIGSQTNVHLDIEQRPGKSPRAFCSPIEVPGKVMLVIQPIGGRDDWEALFHEAGHTEHFARRDAGDLLRELWSLGQGPTAEELLRDVTGAKLEMASVADRVREGLAA